MIYDEQKEISSTIHTISNKAELFLELMLKIMDLADIISTDINSRSCKGYAQKFADVTVVNRNEEQDHE